MDYYKLIKVTRYHDYNELLKIKIINLELVLMTTKAKRINFYNFNFKKNDILLFGRESAGVPKEYTSRD